MMSHHRFMLGCLLLGNLLLGFSSCLAQIDPADMISGWTNGIGPNTVTLTTVPAGQTLVVTHFSWSATLSSTLAFTQYTLELQGNDITRWFLRGYITANSGNGYQTLPVSEGLGTGVVFASGQTVSFRVGWVANQSWFVSWAGYLVPGATSGVEGQSLPATPSSSHLEQNIPNPFNPATEIRYLLDAAGEAGIAIYDAQGRRIRELERGMKDAGEHVIQWDGRNDRGETVASGVYYYELETARGREARKAVFLR